jgi:hypothetical protein
MTTWPDVVEKAITVGLPILFAGAVTIFAATREHRYRDRAEHRQRARAALEQFAISFNKLTETNQRDWLTSKKLLLSKVTLDVERADQRLASLDAIDAHMLDLNNQSSVLMLLGFNTPVDRYSEYVRAAGSVVELLRREPPPSQDEIDASMHATVEPQARLMMELIKAYGKL